SLRYTRNECPTGVSFPAPPEEILTGPRTTLPLSISQARCESRSTHDRAETEQGVPETSGWSRAATAAGAGSPVSAMARSTNRPPTTAATPTRMATVLARRPPVPSMVSPHRDHDPSSGLQLVQRASGAEGAVHDPVRRSADDTAHRPASGGGRVLV